MCNPAVGAFKFPSTVSFWWGVYFDSLSVVERLFVDKSHKSVRLFIGNKQALHHRRSGRNLQQRDRALA